MQKLINKVKLIFDVRTQKNVYDEFENFVKFRI